MGCKPYSSPPSSAVDMDGSCAITSSSGVHFDLSFSLMTFSSL